jgi:hypothetical protein
LFVVELVITFNLASCGKVDFGEFVFDVADGVVVMF